MKPSSKKRWKSLFSNGLLVLSGLLLAGYIHFYSDQFQVLKSLHVGHILVFILFTLAAYAVHALTFKVFTASFGYRVRYSDSFLLVGLALYWNYLPARMGTLIRAALAKTVFGIPLYLSALFMIVPQILAFMLYSLLGLSLCMIFLIQGIQIPPILIGCLGLLFILGFTLSRIKPERFLKSLSDSAAVKQSLAGWNQLWTNLELLFKLAFIQFILILLQSARWYLLFTILTGDSTFLPCILFSIFNYVGGVVSLTPGALGVQEGFVILLSGLLGFPFGETVLVVLVHRAITLLVVFPTGILSSYLLNQKAKSSDEA